MKCFFVYDSSNILSCSQEDNFDEYGIPEKPCLFFPCAKYKSIILGLESKEVKNEKMD